jgi:type II secretory pathway pseudopilin PulG
MIRQLLATSKPRSGDPRSAQGKRSAALGSRSTHDPRPERAKYAWPAVSPTWIPFSAQREPEDIAPFQGFRSCTPCTPRAALRLPWADVGAPLRGWVDRGLRGWVDRGLRGWVDRGLVCNNEVARPWGCHARSPSLARLAAAPRARGLSSGYTLLELLIVGVLVSVLMAGVWSLFRNWSGLYERGERRVQRMQLVRSLCDQFTDDVHAASQAAPPRMGPDVPGTKLALQGVDSPVATAANVALVGGADWLILEVIQPANPWQGRDVGRTREPGTSDTSDTSERVALAAPELRRIVYTFAPPESDLVDSLSATVADMAAEDDTQLVSGEKNQKPPFSGLLRLAVAHESPLVSSGGVTGAMGASAASSGTRDEAFRMRDTVVGGADTDEPLLETAAPTPETERGSSADADPLAGILDRDEVPEVVWFELRYYDGATWRSSWDSQAQGRLPVAVEMRFELKVADPAQAMPTEDGETEFVDASTSRSAKEMPVPAEKSAMSSSMDETVVAGEGEVAETPYHRCVVFLEAMDKP